MGKRVEYRDTFDFRLFPEYTYTRAQNRRLRLFQGRVEHWRAAINYADSFNYPNEINLLYMIGYKPQMKAYVEKTVSNVVVLCADVPPEFLAAYDAYWGFVKQYRGTGYVNQDGVFSPAFFAEREKEEAYRGTGILPDELYRRNDEQAAIISAYQRITEESEKYFSHYLIISKSIPECSISHDELDWLIQEYFPFGREQCGIGEKAYRSLRKIEEALRAGLNRADTAKLLDLPNGVDSYTACQNGIKQCQMNLSVAMQNDGLVDLVQLMEDMKKPPYGWDDDPHAAYCLGYAICDYLDNTWIWDEIYCFQSHSETLVSVLRNVLRGSLGRRHSFVLVSEVGQYLSSRFAYMFGIKGSEYCPRDATDVRILELYKDGASERKIAAELGTISNVAIHKRIVKMQTFSKEDMPFCNMALQICSKIEKTTRWPVAVIDEHLHEVLCGTFDSEKHICIPVFGRTNVCAELSYFTAEKCKALKKVLETINTYVPALIQQKYGTDIDMAELEQAFTTSASGWLWSSETFWECVEHYIKKR